MKYDYLIAGSGLQGAVSASAALDAAKRETEGTAK